MRVSLSDSHPGLYFLEDVTIQRGRQRIKKIFLDKFNKTRAQREGDQRILSARGKALAIIMDIFQSKISIVYPGS